MQPHRVRIVSQRRAAVFGFVLVKRFFKVFCIVFSLHNGKVNANARKIEGQAKADVTEATKKAEAMQKK